VDMDAYKVKEVIGNNPRFVSPFCEPCSYYIWKKHDETVRNEEIEIYWRKLKYMSDNIDRFIQQAFHPDFYEFYGVKQSLVESPVQMCQELVVDSFVFDADNQTIGCCLSNSRFMFGHYMDCLWNSYWELMDSYIC
jgi:hypothetical protein